MCYGAQCKDVGINNRQITVYYLSLQYINGVDSFLFFLFFIGKSETKQHALVQ